MNNKKKRILIIAVVILALLGGAGGWLYYSSTPAGNTANFVTLTPMQASELIKTRSDVMIIDVRGRQELSNGWIDGSVFMPLPDIMQGKITPPKDKPILLVCAVGGRSLGLGKAMAAYGWPMVYNLQGGVSEWARQGLPLKYR